MNTRALLSPALYGGAAAVAVAAVGYGAAIMELFPPKLLAFLFTVVGLVAVALFAGATSLNENSETPDVVAGGEQTVSSPVEAGGPRRVLLVCFSLALALAGVVGLAIFG